MEDIKEKGFMLTTERELHSKMIIARQKWLNEVYNQKDKEWNYDDIRPLFLDYMELAREWKEYMEVEI